MIIFLTMRSATHTFVRVIVVFYDFRFLTCMLCATIVVTVEKED